MPKGGQVFATCSFVTVQNVIERELKSVLSAVHRFVSH